MVYHSPYIKLGSFSSQLYTLNNRFGAFFSLAQVKVFRKISPVMKFVGEHLKSPEFSPAPWWNQQDLISRSTIMKHSQKKSKVLDHTSLKVKLTTYNFLDFCFKKNLFVFGDTKNLPAIQPQDRDV